MDRMTRSLALLMRIPALVGMALIRIYRLSLSALLGRQCRYLPTCSEYAEVAIGRFGLWPGLWMGIARLQRCGPGGASGYDPVPDELAGDVAWYRPWRYGRWKGDHMDPKSRLDL